MFSQLALDITFGFLVLGLINLFHRVTQGIFYPTVDFEQYNPDLIRGLFTDPVIFFYHFISFGIHAFFAGIAVTARCLLFSTPLKFVDVVVICVTAPSALLLFYWIKYQLFRSATSELNIEDTTGLLKSYQASQGGIFVGLANALKAYIPGVIILLIGGLIGWFAFNAILNRN